jgi:Ca-activated chloride channel homolog
MSGRHSARMAPRGRATRGGRRGRTAAVVALALVLVGAATAIVVVLQSGDDKTPAAAVSSSSATCTNGVNLDVITTPPIEAAVQQVAQTWVESKPQVGADCVSVQVSGGDSSTTAEEIAAKQTNEVWIPDSSIWPTQLAAVHPSLAPLLAIGQSVGTSPLVVAAAPGHTASLAATAKSGWPAILTTASDVAVPNPLTTATGALATLVVQSAAGSAPTVVGAFGRLAASSVPSVSSGFAALQTKPTTAPPFVSSEQDLVLANRGQTPRVADAVYPSGPAPVLDFPVVRVSRPDASPQLVAAQKLFVSQLASSSARQAFAASGLRADPKLPLAPATDVTGIAQEPVTATSSPSRTALVNASRLWVAAVKPSNLLAAIDVSGSMGEDGGNGRTKIALAAGAAETALTIIPDSWTLGLWTFATPTDTSPRWTELVPLTSMSWNRKTLESAAGTLPNRVGGNTPLYETAWAAFQDVSRNYVDGDVNIVALLTDGANVDQSGMTLDTLTARLKVSYKSSRPVRIVTIGIGPDADTNALQQISNATHGQSYTVRDPTDIRTVLLQAIVANN